MIAIVTDNLFVKLHIMMQYQILIYTKISLYRQIYLSRQVDERQESIGLVFEAFEQPEAVCHRPIWVWIWKCEKLSEEDEELID